MRTSAGTAFSSPAAFTWLRAAAYIELTKPRMTFLILLSTVVGFYVASSGSISVFKLFITLLGTGLVAGGSAALNMFTERRLDALMNRTMSRPIPSGRLPETNALVFGIAVSAAGLMLLAAFTPLAALLTAVTEAGYLLVYTPLKRRTWLCTLAGAIPGALPIVIGWSAASGRITGAACALFAVVFFWQLPHFYAIGWMYRDEYARAGFSILPAIDGSGARTATQVRIFSAIVVLASLVPALLRISGSVYLVGSLLLGLLFLACGISFSRFRDRPSAQRLFIFSVFYLPLLYLLLVIDKLRA